MTGISVIIPTYNRASLLLRALNSVKRQTLSCEEIIVVDDGSEDSTRECVLSFIEKCEIPVRYLYQNNQGPAAARNIGIRKARYPYLAFLDSDDHWKRKKLAIQYKLFTDNPDALVAHTQESWLRRGQHLNQKKIHKPRNGDIFQHCLQLCAVGMSTIMVKKKLFEKVGMFDEKLRCCEDYDLWLRISSRCPFFLAETPLTIKEGGREDQVSYQYRVGMDRLRIGSILSLLHNEVLSMGQKKSALEELHRKCFIYGKGCVKHDRKHEGRSYLELAEWSKKASASEGLTGLLHVPEDPYNAHTAT